MLSKGLRPVPELVIYNNRFVGLGLCLWLLLEEEGR